MTTRRGWTFLTVLVFAVSGCALAEVNVKPPEAGLEKPIPGGNQRQVIVAIPFQEARQSTSRCGVQKGGYGNETAQAVCQRSEEHTSELQSRLHLVCRLL